MSITYTETKSDTDSRTEIDIGNGRMLNINITGEGIIMDVSGLEGFRDGLPDDYVGPETYKENVHLGTVKMTFDEWAEWVLGLMPRAYHMSNAGYDA
jgi:hypothetical protein